MTNWGRTQYELRFPPKENNGKIVLTKKRRWKRTNISRKWCSVSYVSTSKEYLLRVTRITEKQRKQIK